MITPTRGLSKPLLIEQGRLLVVDDNVDYLRTLELLLDGTGFECEYYDNGPLAIEAARRDEFDVLLVDVRMAPLDGVETARGVKAIQPLLAVVMMTGFDKEDTPLEALRLGAVDYIDKPITNAGAFMRMLAQQVRAVRSSKELRTTKERLETVIENVDAGVVVLDAEGRIEDINQAAADLIAPGGQPLVGRAFREACGVPELAFPLPAEGSVTKTFEHSADRRRRLFQVAATRLSDAGARPAGSVLLIKDLTALADSQKAEGWRQMSRAITHGMKTPLATLRMRLERLKSKPDCQPLQAEMDTLLRVVEELHARLRDLVDFVKLEISPTESDLNDTVAVAIRHFEPHRRATTRIELEPAGVALRLAHSQAAIELALENLLANGQESTTDAVTLRVECAWDAAARQAVVQVSDNGPGIPAEAREDLFRRPVNSTKAGGSGLGAALVKYIVDQHRGSMTWQSPLADGRGTRVTLRLPTESGTA